ncbi:hypothetical protein WB334_25530, partial [Escherichia coli]|uniref:hypothetical protein n=1 Tax=Escherichia coli TaxID=562 RepID=UPI002157ECC2
MFGHVGLELGDGRCLMATTRPGDEWARHAHVVDVAGWTRDTGLSYRGWSHTNGVNRLPEDFAEEDDMALTPEQLDAIARAVWTFPMRGGGDLPGGRVVVTETAAQRVRSIRRSTHRLRSRTMKLEARVAALEGAL